MNANGHDSINFNLSDEHREIQRLARDFARKEIAPKAEHYDKTHEYPWPIVREAQKLGLTTMAVPEQYGGLGLSLFEECLVTEELAWGCSGTVSYTHLDVYKRQELRQPRHSQSERRPPVAG